MENRQETDYFPIHLDIMNRKCLVIGGGKVAERKVRSLLHCKAMVTVVSLALTDELQLLANQCKINYINRCYQVEDLSDCFLVISATNDNKANAIIANDCFDRNILVNVVDDPVRCNFIIPSELRRGSLCLTVSTQGKSPLLAKKIREKLEECFSPEYAEFVEIMGQVRQRVMEKEMDREKRYLIYNRLIDSNILELLKEGKQDLIKEQINRCMLL